MSKPAEKIEEIVLHIARAKYEKRTKLETFCNHTEPKDAEFFITQESYFSRMVQNRSHDILSHVCLACIEHFRNALEGLLPEIARAQ